MNEKPKRYYKTLSVPPSIHRKVKDIAHDHDMTHIEVVEKALVEFERKLFNEKKGGE